MVCLDLTHVHVVLLKHVKSYFSCRINTSLHNKKYVYVFAQQLIHYIYKCFGYQFSCDCLIKHVVCCTTEVKYMFISGINLSPVSITKFESVRNRIILMCIKFCRCQRFLINFTKWFETTSYFLMCIICQTECRRKLDSNHFVSDSVFGWCMR